MQHIKVLWFITEQTTVLVLAFTTAKITAMFIMCKFYNEQKSPLVQKHSYVEENILNLFCCKMKYLVINSYPKDRYKI